MGAIAAVAPEAVLERYEQLTKDRARLADRIGQAEEKIGALESERQQLLPRISDGDRSASARADSLDREKVEMQRQLDGLRMKLGDLDRQIAELAGPRHEIYQKRTEEERRRKFESYMGRIQKHSRNVIAHWRAACRERFQEGELLFEALTDLSLTEAERSELVSAAVMAETSQSAAALNEAWVNARGPLRPLQRLIISASKPPDGLKHLEELK